VEQIAFSPSHVVPGWEPSVDPVLQSRLFSYPDTHRHRLGVNYQQIPVNCPLHVNNPLQRDGAMAVNGNYGPAANYPSSLQPPAKYDTKFDYSNHEQWAGEAVTMVSEVSDDDYAQALGLWKVLGKQPGQQQNLIYNVAVNLCNAKSEIRKRTYQMFGKVDKSLGQQIQKETEKRASAKVPSTQARL